MKLFLFAGLGNPGSEYHLTRHNTGWLFLDFCRILLCDVSSHFDTKTKLYAEIATSDLPDRRILLAKPTTFMNDSGRSVKAIVDFYKLNPESDLVLIHDDLDLNFGQYQITKGKGPRQHNGLNSVISSLGTENFRRLRIGIANEWLPQIKAAGRSVADDFVLDTFSQSEQDYLPKLFQQALADLNQDIIK